METTIIKIGNSQGLIIPKRLLGRLGIIRRVKIQVKDGGIFIEPVHNYPRKGWAEAFAAAVKAGHQPEEDLLDGIENEFDKEQWKL